MSTSTPTDTVVAIGQINLTGNVIPASWWRHITLPSGRPDQTAITLLAEIVYWYRPVEVRNETTGELVGYRKRFRGDKLQRSYQAFAEQFGFGKRETADALKRLRDAGLITLELRTIEALDGVKCSNVLFVEVRPGAIAAITNVTPVPSEGNSHSRNANPVTAKRNTPQRRNVTGGTPNVDTNTEITTKTTTEIKNTIGASADAPAPTRSAKQDYSPEFETAWQAYPKRAGGNSKSAAWKSWKARLKDGVKPEDMLAGVKRYAAYVRATGSVGTQYVRQA
ncbi:replication protein, partial [Salmonella enterica]